MVDQRHVIGLDKTLVLKAWRQATGCVFTHADKVRERHIALQPQQRTALGTHAFLRERAPVQHADNLAQGRRGQIGAVSARRQRFGRVAQQRGLRACGFDLRADGVFVPHKTGAAAFHRFIAVRVQTPVEIPAGGFLPVALTQLVGKAVIHRAHRQNADQIQPGSGFSNVGHNLFGGRQLVSGDRFGGLNVSGQQQVRVFGDIGQRLTQISDHAIYGLGIRGIAGEHDLLRDMLLPLHQTHSQIRLRHLAGLAHQSMVEADKIRGLAFQPQRITFTGLQTVLNVISQREEMRALW